MNPKLPQKKRGEISVHTAFAIIYALLFSAIVFGPIIFVNDETGRALDTLSILFNGGFLLIVGVVILHVVLAIKEKNKQ